MGMRSMSPGRSGRRCEGEIDKVATRGYFGGMRKVGIKALKDNLSAYVRAAEAGETVLVTDRGKVVAELVPPRAPAKPQTNEEILDQLEREGLLIRAKNRGPWKKPPERIGGVPFEQLMRELDADREDR
jgi:prevent-host-death family protein